MAVTVFSSEEKVKGRKAGRRQLRKPWEEHRSPWVIRKSAVLDKFLNSCNVR
jgi:hypothetical protein